MKKVMIIMGAAALSAVMTFCAQAEMISYYAWNDDRSALVPQEHDCIRLTKDMAELSDGKWYYADSELVFNRITVNGAAHLILCDGLAKVTANQGVCVDWGNSLHIYGQRLGTGQLIATGWEKCAGIGAAFSVGYEGVGKIDIHGGIISAQGGQYAAGIGGFGGYDASRGLSGAVTIYGGQVTARGGSFSAGIGGGDAYEEPDAGKGSIVAIYGGTVVAIADKTPDEGYLAARDIGHGLAKEGDNGSLTIYGGSVKAETDRGLAKDAAGRELFCVTAKCAGLKVQRLTVGGLEGYGTGDVYPIEDEKIGECVFLRLPTRKEPFCFTISDETTTYHYRVQVAERDVIVEPVRPLGFFVNGEDISQVSGTGWEYVDKVLSLNGNGTYVLSGLATNDEMQISLEASGLTVILSNAVVCAKGRPALDVTQNAMLKMAGGASYLSASSNNAAAVLVAQGATLTVGLASGVNSDESMVGVFNDGSEAAVAGQGTVVVGGGTFFVWSDRRASAVTLSYNDAVGVLVAGDTPETMRYVANYTDEKCALVGPGATVTVKGGIPHVTDVVVSNLTGTISRTPVEGCWAYRVMLGDDIFVGYTVEQGYFTRTENPLRYEAVGGDITVDASVIPVAVDLPYRAWNPDARQMEDRTCSGYEIVTEWTETFEDGKWYAVTNAVRRGMITVKGVAHLILCDGARLTAIGGNREAGIAVTAGNSLTIHGQSLGTGELVAQGAVASSGIGGLRSNGSCGAVTIDGGRVRTTGGKHGAGIGGQWGGAAGAVTINGGQVLAQGGWNAAGIGSGNQGVGGTVTINGGTVTAAGGSGAGIGRGNKSWGVFALTIDGGSVKANIAQNLAKNSAGATLRCVTVKVEGLKVERLKVDGLDEYGANDIYAIDGRVYLRLPDGNHMFTISDGQTTHRYFAAVKGVDITVQPLPLTGDVGFFVNGEDIGVRAGDGWTYGEDKVLSLNGNGTYVLSGLATNNEAQVRVTQQDTTVVLSNAVVFTEGRPALDVACAAALQMAGGASFLGTTNDTAAVSVAQGAALAVGLAPDANRLETMIGVFNYDSAAAVAGQGSTKVNGGTFFVWSDAQAIGLPQFTVDADELMQAGDAPEVMKYATTCGDAPCVLIGPSVAVTVKNGIPHVTVFAVSNAVEAILGTVVTDGTAYRVMLGDDVFVGYALEEGYVTDADNPLTYASVEDNVTVDGNTIPTVLGIPYREWNATTRQMEDRVCTDYEVVTSDTTTFEDGKWYVVKDSISRGMITVNGSAHLILCDGAKLTTRSYIQEGIRIPQGKELAIYGQKLDTGELEAKGGAVSITGWAGIGSFFGGWRLTINGGRILATGGNNGAGIGGSHGAPGGDVTINGGMVTATGSRNGAGIGGGGGNQCDGGTVTINGGTVTARGGSYGAGIGGGGAEYSRQIGGSGGTVTINGGTVTAMGSRDGAGIGGGYRGDGCMVKVTGGTVTAKGGERAVDIGRGCNGSSDGSLTIDGGSVKANVAADFARNSTPTNVYRVVAKVERLKVERLKVGGLRGYGTNDIVAVDGKVYLWLPNGTHHFTLSDGTTTRRYCAVVKGRDVTVEPLGPVGFFVNGEDIGVDGTGDGWHYQEKVLTLDNAKAYVLSGGATNDEVQVKAAANGATVVLSNAVVFTSGRPALDVAQNAALLMAGGTSYFAATNESAAVSVAEGAALAVGLAPNADWKESMIGVFNYGKENAIAGSGAVAVTGGMFFVWADEQAVETPDEFACGEAEVMMTGMTPETLAYATFCTFESCILVAPGVTVTVKDIPHVTGFAVSNGVEAIQGAAVSGGTAYRVLFGDDVFVYYTVEAGYVSEVDNPLRYVEVNGDVVVDSDTIPVVLDTVSYVDRWSGSDETVVVTGNYVFVDADLTTLASGVTYVVEGMVTNRNILSLSGPATLVLSDGATLVAEGGFTSAGWPAATNALSIHGQAAGDGLLLAKDFRDVDVAVHGVTTVTDGIFGGRPVFLGGTVSANVVSNGQLMVVAGGNICVENRFALACDGGERAVHSVICPVPGVTGRVTIEGLTGYCTGDIFPVDGRICLYLPEGEHVFTVNGVRMRALVLGDGTVAERDDGGYFAYGRSGEFLGAFARLTNAVHAAKDGGTVKLTNDCHEAGAFVLPEGAAVTLDGCGYRMTLDATDFNAPSAQVGANAALCITNLVLTRTAVSRTAGLLAVADGGALEMLDCAITNCDAAVYPLVSVANGGFRAAGVRFAGNTAGALVEAAVRSENTRFGIANWSATGNVCDKLFAVDNLSGLVDACEIGAGEQDGNACRVADLVVGSGAASLRGAPPLAKVRLAGFAMIADALHSHLAYRDAPPQGGVVLDVSSPDMRLGSVIVSNAFGQAVSPQAVDLVTPGCRVIADAGGSLRLEQAWARPFVVRAVSGAQTNYVSYASAEEAISHGGRDLLLMSYEEGGSRHADLSGDISVPTGEQVSLDTVRLTVTTNEIWTVPSPDPVSLDGNILVAMNGMLRLGNVLPREVVLDREATVLVEARPPQDRYLYFRFAQTALDHILADGVVVASTCLTSLELRDACAVLNEGYALIPADNVPAGMSGALWLIPTKNHEAWIDGEEALRPSFIGAMESANDAVDATNVTMYAISYTNETDGSVIGGYSSMGREIAVGGTDGTVRLTVGSKRICVKGTGERYVAGTPFPPTQLDLGGSTLRIRAGSVLALADVDVVGAFTLAGEGVLDLLNYQGTPLAVSIDPASGGGPRKIVEGADMGKIRLAYGQKGELFVKEGCVWWQLGVTCKYEQIDNGVVEVRIYKNGNLVKTDPRVEVKNGTLPYVYTDSETGPRAFTLMAVYIDWADRQKTYAPADTLYESTDGSYKTLVSGTERPYDLRLRLNRGLKVRCKLPRQPDDAEAGSLSNDDVKPVDLSVLSESEWHELEIKDVTDKDLVDAKMAELVAAYATLSASIPAAAGGSKITWERFSKWMKAFGVFFSAVDFAKMITKAIVTAENFRVYPLVYDDTYRADQFTPLSERCAKENGPGDKGKCIILRHAIEIMPQELGKEGLVKMIADSTTDIEAYVKIFVNYEDKSSRVFESLDIVYKIIDIIYNVLISDKIDPASAVEWASYALTRLTLVIETACILTYRYEYPLPPPDGSLALSSGVKYDFVKMKFDATRTSRYLRDMTKPPATSVRTAPILVAKPGSTLEFDTCELRNFKYSSPSGLVYVCSGATLVLKDFIVASNTCTTATNTPPIVAEKGATVWVCGKSDIQGIEAVGADLRVGYGPHGTNAPHASELTGTGTINIFGETGFGAKIGTVTFSNETSKALNSIVSQRYNKWVRPDLSNVSGDLTVVWKEKAGTREKLEPITFRPDKMFSVSVIRSGAGNQAIVTGGLAVPTKEVLKELPLEFSIVSTDLLKGGNTNETSVAVNPETGEFSQSFDNLGNSHFFRLKYRNILEGSK